MSELTLLLLQLGFLLLLWFFVFSIVYSLRSDLFGDRVRRLPASQQPAAAQQSQGEQAQTAPAPTAAATPWPVVASAGVADQSGGTARRLVITSGSKEGLELALDDQQLTIGRSGESGLVIRDDYTSTHHARLVLWGDDWVIQDLDSTNGTYLDGSRVTAPTPVPLNTPVRIGTTSFELRR